MKATLTKSQKAIILIHTAWVGGILLATEDYRGPATWVVMWSLPIIIYWAGVWIWGFGYIRKSYSLLIAKISNSEDTEPQKNEAAISSQDPPRSFNKFARVSEYVLNYTIWLLIIAGLSYIIFVFNHTDIQTTQKLSEYEITQKNASSSDFKLPFGLRFMMSKNQALEQMKTLEQFRIKPAEEDSVIYLIPNSDDNTKSGFFLDFRNNQLVKIESIKTGMSKQRQGSYLTEVVAQITISLSSKLESASRIENNQIYKFITPNVVVILSGHKDSEGKNDFSVNLTFYEKDFFTSEPIAQVPFLSQLPIDDAINTK